MKGRGFAVLAILVVVSAAGCSAKPATPSATHAAGATTSAKSSPTPSATSTPVGFVIPTSCADVVPAARLATFASQGIPLIVGPGSPSTAAFDRYPVESDTTDVQCIWGTSDLSTSVEIDIGSLSETNRPVVGEMLKGQYLTYEKDGDADRYFMNGNELLKFNGNLQLPAQMNVLRTGSWITVAILPGGPANFEVAKTIADEVEQVTHAKP